MKEGAKSVLDYGCGKALLYDEEKYKSMRLNKKDRHYLNLYKRYGNLDYHALYDPAYPKHSKLPKGKYDAVIMHRCYRTYR